VGGIGATPEAAGALRITPRISDPLGARAPGPEERTVSIDSKQATVSPFEIKRLVQAHIDGLATDDEVATLKANENEWARALFRLLDDAEDRFDDAQQAEKGPGRGNVLGDLDAECDRIDDALTALLGPPKAPAPKANGQQPTDVGVTQLHLSWAEGRLVAWAAGLNTEPESHEQILARLDELDGGAIEWEKREPIELPGARQADTVSAPLARTLGWLVALGTTADDERLGLSATWMGLATAAAVELVCQGHMVPQLKQFSGGRRKKGGGDLSIYNVRWVPALVETKTMVGLIESVPGAVMASTLKRDRKEFVNSVLADLTDAITRTAAEQLETPAPPPEPRSRTDVGDAVLGRMDGSAFRAPTQIGSDLVRKLSRWSQPVTGSGNPTLVVQLDPPDESNAWHAAVLVPAAKSVLEPVEVVMATASESRAKGVGRQLTRLERIFPELLRPGGRRRGEVMLSQDEAWLLMTTVGATLTAAGFDVRVPALSRRKATPSLRLTSDGADETVVGARQLANVRWSALFDDIELTADDIARLATEARPLVKSQGKWIELDKADLAQAAAALAERANTTQLSGADMLRHALGLEGNPLAGGISLTGDSWAAGLLRSVNDLPEEPETKPDGFKGELRSYQADALAWLNFLDRAGLGGCLALDMGLGKTPTMLANLALTATAGPSLVIAPPAVVGNWAAEAKRFVPNVKVLVHHGPSRSKGPKLKAAIRKADVVISTYGTAVRDMDELSEVDWNKVVIDEAQAIKNPAAETSQQLRRLTATTRVALTGTPIENGLGDLWAIMDWANPGLLGGRTQFIAQLNPDNKSSKDGGEDALKALNGILVYRRTKAEPSIAAELPDRIDELDHCAMTTEQIGLYQAVIDSLVVDTADSEQGSTQRKGAVLAAITALKQICNHPVNYREDGEALDDRSGKLARLNEIMESVFAADERLLIFTHFATWGERLATYLTERYELPIACYHGGLARGARDRLVDSFQKGTGPGAMVLSLKAGGTGLNLTAANHVVLYDRWWNPAVEDQARDRVWRIGQKNTVICHRLVCPGTVDERVEEVVAGKRQIANLVLPKSSSVGDLDATQLQQALGIDADALMSLESEAELVGADQ